MTQTNSFFISNIAIISGFNNIDLCSQAFFRSIEFDVYSYVDILA